MILELCFVFYFLTLQLGTIYLGINFLRIRDKLHIHPRLLCMIVPFVINYIVSNTIFNQLPPLLTVFPPCILILLISTKFQKVRIIGVTGCIATGKSTLTRLIRQNYEQIHIIDCDQITREIRKKGQPGYKLLIKLLGNEAQQFLNPNTRQIQEQQRKKLNEYTFNNRQFRKKLTRQMGKLILLKVFKQITINIITGNNIILIDAALLYQSKILQYICFPIALVGCSEQTQLQRLIKRDTYTEPQARQRIASQMPLTQKQKKTNLYLSNQSTPNDLLKQFSTKIKNYIELPQSKKSNISTINV